ncbi:little elongation complex subunit 1 [Pholidichthys leucotaenia]
MMPGDSQTRTVAIAADATAGSCQNCSVLQQSLNEYVSSFLALKQKITGSDDAIRLQQQLEELQVRLNTLEQKTADYESVQEELQEKREALRAHGRLAEEIETLKKENGQMVAENKKLEDRLQYMRDLTEAQTCEHAQLKREKAAVENDLLKTQACLQKSQEKTDQVEKLLKENTEMTLVKENLENKVRQLEDLVNEQNHQIPQLTRDKILLQRNVNDLQASLIKLERERNKDCRSTSTQASAPAEPRVDKEKIRTLLQSLWACVEPERNQPASLSQLPELSYKQVLPSAPQAGHCSDGSEIFPSSSPTRAETRAAYTQMKPSSDLQNATQRQASLRRSNSNKQRGTGKTRKRSCTELKTHEPSADMGSPEICIEDIMKLFKPIGPCISPLPGLDIEMEHMEMADGEKENWTKLCQEEPLKASLPVIKKIPKSSALETTKNVDFLQEDGHISNKTNFKDLEQKELGGIVKMKDRTNTNDEEMHPQEDMPVEQEPDSDHLISSLPSSSSTSERTDLVEVGPSAIKAPDPQFTMSPNSLSETGNASSESKDLSETFTDMDVDLSPSKNNEAKFVSCAGKRSPKGSDPTAITEEDGGLHHIAPSSLSDSVNDSQVASTENDLDMNENHQDLCLGGATQNTTALNHQDDTKSLYKGIEMSEDSPPSTNNGDLISCSSDKEPDEKIEIDVPVLPPEEDDWKGAQETGPSDPALALNSDVNKMPPRTTFVFKEKHVTTYANQSHDQVDEKNPTKGNVDLKTVKNNIMESNGSYSQETNTVGCKSLEESIHSVCRQLSPVCLLPDVAMQAIKGQPRKVNFDAITERIATNKNTPVPKDKIKEGCTALLICKSPATKEQGESFELGDNMDEKQILSGIREENVSPVVIPAEASTPEGLRHARSEMGPPLPLLLTPVSATKMEDKPINPRHAIGKLSFDSPMDSSSPPTTPVQVHLTPNSQQLCSFTNSPVPPIGAPSSPLQFGSATPKHAVPVPGRLPLSAVSLSSSSSNSPSQENSMRILDTMYPELSARARTLSLLKGNVTLGICSSESGTLSTTTESQLSSFKTINSSSTAFTKTEVRGGKRLTPGLPQSKSSKFPRLDNSSPGVPCDQGSSPSSNGEETASLSQTVQLELVNTETPLGVEAGKDPEQNLIVNSLNKIERQCFDLLPVIRSHLYVGNFPKTPVLRDEEKEVIAEICQSSLAEDMILAILNKLKSEKSVLTNNYMQALCRVYTGICRQKNYLDKAHVLAYSILIEDFKESAKLILFMVTTWPTVLSHSHALCQAIHAITKLKAPEGLISCLSAFLGWEKTPPCDIDQLISRTLTELKSGSNLSFTKHSRYGDDLGTEAWNHVFSLLLCCSAKKWKWTYHNLLSKELWPLMNEWVTQPRDHQKPISNVTVATVVRLIGCLGQLGIKERCVSSTVAVANVMNTFGRHGPSEGVPWEVQLAAIYCICDLSPCNPKQAMEAIAGWREETPRTVPRAVTSSINQLASICRQVKR